MLTEQDRRIAVLHSAGWQNLQIAQELKLHRNTVRRRLQRPAVRAFLAQYQTHVQEHLTAQTIQTLGERCAQVADQAVGRLTALLDHGSPHTVCRVAQFILDCGPLRATRDAAPRQSTPLPREDSQLDPYWPIRQHAQAMAKGQAQQGQRQAEAVPRTQEPAPEPPSPGAAMPREQGPDPALYTAQEERWRARLEELKRWPV